VHSSGEVVSIWYLDLGKYENCNCITVLRKFGLYYWPGIKSIEVSQAKSEIPPNTKFPFRFFPFHIISLSTHPATANLLLALNVAPVKYNTNMPTTPNVLNAPSRLTPLPTPKLMNNGRPKRILPHANALL